MGSFVTIIAEPRWVRLCADPSPAYAVQLSAGNGQRTTDNGPLVGSFVTISRATVGSFVTISRAAVGSFVAFWRERGGFVWHLPVACVHRATSTSPKVPVPPAFLLARNAAPDRQTLRRPAGIRLPAVRSCEYRPEASARVAVC